MTQFLGYSEIQLHRFFASQNNAIFYDIGARHGEFSIPLAQQCKVIAFEPSTDNFEILQQKSKHIQDQYKCFNIALSDTDYECETNFKDCDKNKYQKICYRKLDKFIIDKDRKSTRLNSSHVSESRMPSSA